MSLNHKPNSKRTLPGQLWLGYVAIKLGQWHYRVMELYSYKAIRL